MKEVSDVKSVVQLCCPNDAVPLSPRHNLIEGKKVWQLRCTECAFQLLFGSNGRADNSFTKFEVEAGLQSAQSERKTASGEAKWLADLKVESWRRALDEFVTVCGVCYKPPTTGANSDCGRDLCHRHPQFGDSQPLVTMTRAEVKRRTTRTNP